MAHAYHTLRSRANRSRIAPRGPISSRSATGADDSDSQPQNVLVNEVCTQVILLDFGIASWLAQEATAASTPEALEGTLAYISPEQTGRTARTLDARTDLYSFGVMLFESDNAVEDPAAVFPRARQWLADQQIKGSRWGTPGSGAMDQQGAALHQGTCSLAAEPKACALRVTARARCQQARPAA